MNEQNIWYYMSEKNEQFGPISEFQIRELIVSGTLNRFTRVWKPGFNSWVELGNTSLVQFMYTEPKSSESNIQIKKKSTNGLWIALVASMIVILALGVLIGLMFLRTSKMKKEGSGFNSPEDAAKAFAEAYATKDIDNMYKSCALESYVDHFDIEKYVERMQSYYVPNKMYQFGKSDETAILNERLREMELTSSFYYIYTIPGCNRSDIPVSWNYGYSLPETEIEEISNLFKGMDAIDTIKVKGMETSSEFCERTGQKYSGELNKKLENELGGECNEFVFSMDIDGEAYYLFLQTITYDSDKSYILNTGGSLASLFGVSNSGLILESELSND